MIINIPGLFSIALGTDKRIPEMGDDNVVIPPLVMPVTEPMTPNQIVTSATDVQNTSNYSSTSATVTNGGPTTTSFVTLAKGLWDLTVTFTTRFNWVGTGTPPSAHVRLNNGLFTNRMISDLASGTATVPTVRVSVLKVRILLPVNCSFDLVLGANGAGQTSDALVEMLANRIL